MSGKGRCRGDSEKKKENAEKRSSSAKAGLQFPVDRIGRYLREGKYANRLLAGAPVYLAAVLEFLCAEILELAGNVARGENDIINNNSIEGGGDATSLGADGTPPPPPVRIGPQHITTAVKSDEELHTSIIQMQNKQIAIDKDEIDAAKIVQQMKTQSNNQTNVAIQPQKQTHEQIRQMKLAAKQQRLQAKLEKQKSIQREKERQNQLRQAKALAKQQLAQEKQRKEIEKQRQLEEEVRLRLIQFREEKERKLKQQQDMKNG